MGPFRRFQSFIQGFPAEVDLGQGQPGVEVSPIDFKRPFELGDSGIGITHGKFQYPLFDQVLWRFARHKAEG